VRFCREQVSSGLFGVNRICRAVGISKTTYYASKDPVERFEEKHLKLKDWIVKAIEAHPAYGVRRLQRELKEAYRIVIGRDRLGRLLKLWHLSLSRKIKKTAPNMLQRILQSLAGRTNLLIQMTLERPLQAITSDITELVYRGGKVYLCVHKDAFGQMVHGFSLGLNMTASLVMQSLREAQRTIKGMKRQLVEKVVWHQDRGSQYTSYEYTQAVLETGRLSYSDPGTPTHNPGQESFFGRFKNEYRDEIAELETFEEVQEFVKGKIQYYNHERRHTSIGLVAPCTFTKSFLSIPSPLVQ